ncbi:MAG: hypothetical protein ACI4L7_03655 [Christensenellales bacterium]
MKKGGARVSGVFTLLFSLIILLCAVLHLGSVFSIEFLQKLTENSTIEIIHRVFIAIFIMPLSLILNGSFGIDYEIVQQVLAIFTVAFYFLGLLWGIKEITLAGKTDEKYAKCSRTCRFVLIIKIIVFVYLLYVFASSFYDQALIVFFESVNSYITFVPKFTTILSAVLAFIAFLLYLIPEISFFKAKRKFQADMDYQEFMSENGEYPEGQVAQQADGQYYNQYPQEQNYNDQYAGGQYVDEQGNVQYQYYANQYDQNGAYNQGPNLQTQYVSNNVEPLNPQAFTQNPNRSGVSIIPGQNGVPYNITPKGIEDLARLERLHSSGAIDDKNYFAMRKKVCQINVSSN